MKNTSKRVVGVAFLNRIFSGKRANRPATTVGNHCAAVSRSVGRRGRLRPARRRRCRAVGRPPLRLVDGTAAARATATPHDPVAADRTAARICAAFLSCNSCSTVILSRRRRRSRFSSPVSAAPRSVSTLYTHSCQTASPLTDVRTAGSPFSADARTVGGGVRISGNDRGRPPPSYLSAVGLRPAAGRHARSFRPPWVLLSHDGFLAPFGSCRQFSPFRVRMAIPATYSLRPSLGLPLPEG